MARQWTDVELWAMAEKLNAILAAAHRGDSAPPLENATEQKLAQLLIDEKPQQPKLRLVWSRD